MKEIELKLSTNYIDYNIIKLTFKGNYEIECNIRIQIYDLTFLDTFYYNIFGINFTKSVI